MWRGLLANDLSNADIVVFGIATDANCSVGNGAAKAPEILRQCSEFLPPLTRAGMLIPPILYDLGDVKEFDYAQVYEKMCMGKSKKLTLILGGDHSVSILSQKAYKQLHDGKRGIIHIDAHADICDFYNGSDYSHACVNRRALDNGYMPEDITMIGIRSYELQETEFLEHHSVDVYSTDKVLDIGVEKTLDEICRKYENYEGVYLSFDIDCVDPAYAPGTGTPEAFGLPSRDVLKLIEGFVSRLPIDMMDVVEVSPPLDCNNITSWLALKYILEVLNIVNNKKREN